MIQIIGGIFRICKHNLLAQYVLAAIVYLIFSYVLMGSALTQCSTTSYGYPSDGTGGIGWFQWADEGGARWDFTSKSNYPFGENLNRPNFITSYALYIPYIIVSSLTNQICGINIMTVVGLLTTALVMFGFVKWLLNNSYIALFAGFGAAFVPYAQLKAQGHLAYIFGSIFIALIWSFLWFIKKPTLKRLLLPLSIYVGSLYVDGYYVMISTALMGVLVAFFLLDGVIGLNKSKKQLSLYIKLSGFKNNLNKYKKIIVVGLVALVVLLLPIVYVQLKHGNEIQTTLANSRGNIEAEADVYGARPADYLLPSINNHFVSQRYVNWRFTHMHNSNPSESTLYVGYTIILLSSIAILYYFKKTASDEVRPLKRVIQLMALIVIILLCFSLPPYVSIGQIRIPSLTDIVIQITQNWRVFSRFFIVTHVAMVILASIGLYLLTIGKSSLKRGLIISICFILLALEYMPGHTKNWDLINDTPKVYTQLAHDASVKVLAEYPIVDQPSSTLPDTFTFQQIHGKAVVNANSSTTNQRYLRQSIAGIGDKQTLGVLRALGVDVITTFAIDADSVNGLATYAAPEESVDSIVGTVYSYRILPGAFNTSALIARDGFIISLGHGATKSTWSMMNRAVMEIQTVGKNLTADKSAYFKVSFLASAYGGGAQLLTIKQDGVVLWEGNILGVQDHKITFLAHNTPGIVLEVPGVYSTPSLIITEGEAVPQDSISN